MVNDGVLAVIEGILAGLPGFLTQTTKEKWGSSLDDRRDLLYPGPRALDGAQLLDNFVSFFQQFAFRLL